MPKQSYFEASRKQTRTSRSRTQFSSSYASEETKTRDAAPLRAVPAAFQTATAALALVPADCIHLLWSDLECFSTVDRQFQQWGVTFSNAVALRPSNPAFPTYGGDLVLMGAPKQGWLEVKFRRPVRYVSSRVTSSRSLQMMAYDSNGQRIAAVPLLSPNCAESGSAVSPNAPLGLHADNIHRVVFSSFDGNFTLGNLCFHF
ncbi:hypothetical protein [Geitlerinema sp. PCC 7407]|uniref:hypothetical protein n=1 Tax=Geitlerinema sp. PCC 7407 TaxID=1173025 RepID=UPI00029FC5C0|nr:hypothetical protein [Geitlerinema sp. PCC 7407]AFY66157.1 hypothetical protein GEI7407_1666 [Geitlerinema sp. PCC 7407]